MTLFVKLFVAIFVLLVTFSWAKTEKTEESRPVQKVKMIYKKSELHQFSGANLKGKLKKPELSYIYERKGLKEERIVNIPENFNSEIIHDAEHL